MFRALALSLIALSLSASDPWTTGDTVRESVSVSLLAADWAQTLSIAGQPVRYHECNQILGPHPSRAKVNQYFASCIVGHAAIAYALPAKWRQAFQYLTIGLEVGCVGKNAKIGIRMKF